MFLMLVRAAHDIGLFISMLTRSWGGIASLGFVCLILFVGIHRFQRQR
jgi:hypothetical protein